MGLLESWWWCLFDEAAEGVSCGIHRREESNEMTDLSFDL